MSKSRDGEPAVAQDLLNIIRATNTCIDALLDGGGDLADLQARLTELDYATRRVAQHTRRLRGGRELEDRAPVSPARVIVGMHEFLARVLGGEIELTVDILGDVPKVASSPSAIEEMLLNLVLNAKDAITGPGEVSITVVGEDDRVTIEVRDNGRGIDPEVLESACEPFVGTKGDRSGLGLWAVKRIVDEAGGALSIHSDLPKGTRVRIELADVARVNEGMVITGDLARGRVLVVDDDRKVRTSVARTLSKIGYGVEEAADGAEAMALLDDGEAFDLLLTDVVMPVVGGLELVRHAQFRADMPAVYMTSYLDLVLDEAQATRALVLSKPFTASELVDTVHAALRPADVTTT